MKKYFSLVVCLLTIAIISLGMTGCEKADSRFYKKLQEAPEKSIIKLISAYDKNIIPEDTYDELKISPLTTPSSDVVCGYRTFNQMKKSDMKVQFYYGRLYFSQWDTDEALHAKITISNGTDEVSIKEINDFGTEKYKWDGGSKFSSFNYSEIISVPKKLIVGEAGILHFDINGFYKEADEQIEFRSGNRVSMYYKVMGNNVLLSITSFE